MVHIYNQNYMPHYFRSPGFCDSTFSNDAGKFSFSAIAEGHYNLLVWDSTENKSVFIERIPVFADSSVTVSDILKRPGFLTGIATDMGGNNLLLSYVYIKGSPFYAVTRNSGEFSLGPLPAGVYKLAFFANYLSAPGSSTAEPVMTPINETSTVTVYPDSVSHWSW